MSDHPNAIGRAITREVIHTTAYGAAWVVSAWAVVAIVHAMVEAANV